jgi:hypothetical protein
LQKVITNDICKEGRTNRNKKRKEVMKIPEKYVVFIAVDKW